jgi:Tfp pilus assembly protein PilX
MTPHRLAQAGISLVVTLVALVLLSLAAVALMRNVDTTNLVAGNLAFKQATTSAADLGTESAISWLQTNNTGLTLHDDSVNSGYYATSLTNLDVSGKSANAARALADWNGDNCAYASGGSYATCVRTSSAIASNGSTTRYLITRMCKTTGDPNAAGNGCARPVANSAGSSPKRGELKYGEDKRFATQSGPYFRIVVRAEGPRNTVSYTESYVHF